MRQRSKSTVPFDELNAMERDNCYLIADVDDDSYEYVHENHHESNKQQHSRPYVGITPYTRFRRAPTLDMIRSTKMPLKNNNVDSISPPSSSSSSSSSAFNNNKPFYLSNRHEQNNRDRYFSNRNSYFSNSELNNTFHVAQF